MIDSVEAGSCDDVTATNLLLGLGTSGHWAQAGGCTPGGCCDHRTSATPRQGVLELTMKFREMFTILSFSFHTHLRINKDAMIQNGHLNTVMVSPKINKSFMAIRFFDNQTTWW